MLIHLLSLWNVGKNNVPTSQPISKQIDLNITALLQIQFRETTCIVIIYVYLKNLFFQLNQIMIFTCWSKGHHVRPQVAPQFGSGRERTWRKYRCRLCSEVLADEADGMGCLRLSQTSMSEHRTTNGLIRRDIFYITSLYVLCSTFSLKFSRRINIKYISPFT